MNLPKTLNFTLPEWSDEDFKRYIQSAGTLEKVKRQAGTRLSGFDEACSQLLSKRWQWQIRGAIQSSIDVRACVYLLANDDDFAKRCEIDRKLLRTMEECRPGLGRLNLSTLLSAWFVRYQQLNVWNLNEFGQHLAKLLDGFRAAGLSRDQSLILKNSKLLFAAGAPEKISAVSVKKGQRIENLCFDLGLKSYSNGTFMMACRVAYYIGQLRSLTVGADHEILRHIAGEDVYNAPAPDDNERFGHEILRILIDRSSAAEISNTWRDVVIAIAGDPRVPHTDIRYQKWWAVLGNNYIAKMKGWLSRLDLKLFLEILKSSAREMNHADRERMFESRKEFMESLIEQGLVHHSRLFLCRNDVYYLKQHYKDEELPEFAEVSSTDTSMIYLQVGGLHMIEGSHSFKVKVMKQLPAQTRITDYAKQHYTDSELRMSINKNARENQYQRGEGYLEKIHDQYSNWQHELIDFFRKNGVQVAAVNNFSQKRPRSYRTRFNRRAS